MYMLGVQKEQMRALDPLELQMFVSCHVGSKNQSQVH